MTHIRTQAARGKDKDPPELLISFLRYALNDVRALSERSGRHLEMAISTLAEDTSVIKVSSAINHIRRS
jgi:hypothetical protein